jgi:fructokinase
MNTTTRIVGIGEILMDIFTDGTATIGGAPFNVAFQAHQLLTANGRGQGEVVSAVGNDDWGRHILKAIEDAGMSTAHVAVNAKYPTGIATVFVSHGEAGFEIAKDQAYDHLDADASLDELATQCQAVAFGSLAQRSAASGKVIRNFVSKIKGQRLYDVNLRENTTDHAKGYSAEILDESCQVASIVKANSGELEEIGELLNFPHFSETGEDRIWRQMEQLRSHYELFAVVITRGAKGAMLCSAHARVRLEDSTLPLDKIHPVGAGDAFSAGLLYGLTQGCTLAVSAQIADRLASWVTGFTSATPQLTDAILADLRVLESPKAN